jgi:nucleotide-binding universal stress UspA family protein
MKIVKILLPISHHGTSVACAHAAFGLAERFGAWLEVLHPCPTPEDRLPYATELSPLDYVDRLIDVEKKQAALEKRQAKKWLAKMAKAFPNVAQELLAVDGLVAPIVSTRAKVADFTVLPSVAAKEETFWAIARDAALFRSGRPLLVVPEGWAGPIGKVVIIAWKDTVEAARSVAAARPFLEDAKEVRLLSITETENDDQTAPAMVDYLTRAGVSAKLDELFSDSQVGPLLLEAATSIDVLLVMGAYGHSRLREWVLGGATDYVLRNTSVPVFLMH